MEGSQSTRREPTHQKNIEPSCYEVRVPTTAPPWSCCLPQSVMFSLTNSSSGNWLLLMCSLNTAMASPLASPSSSLHHVKQLSLLQRPELKHALNPFHRGASHFTRQALSRIATLTPDVVSELVCPLRCISIRYVTAVCICACYEYKGYERGSLGGYYKGRHRQRWNVIPQAGLRNVAGVLRNICSWLNRNG